RSLANDMLTPGGIFDDVPIDATYVSNVGAVYNPSTQIVTEHENRYSISGVKAKVSARMVDNVAVFPNDEQFFVAGDGFTAAGLTVPSKPDDRLEITGEIW